MVISIMSIYVCIPFIAKFSEIKSIMKHSKYVIVTIHTDTWLSTATYQCFSIYIYMSPFEMRN